MKYYMLAYIWNVVECDFEEIGKLKIVYKELHIFIKGVRKKRVKTYQRFNRNEIKKWFEDF